MLIQFFVENYRSFRDKTELNLSASADQTHPEHVCTAADAAHSRALLSAVVFGANAAGKSNILKAIHAAVMTVRTSQSLSYGEPLDWIVPFALDAESAKKPTSFEFVMVIGDVRYVYGFSATREKVTEEYLYAYYSQKPTTIFDREGNEFRFPARWKREFTSYQEKTAENKLFLAVATAWNCEKTRSVFAWFQENLHTFDARAFGLREWFRLGGETKELHRFTLKLLASADIHIKDYRVTGDSADSAALMRENRVELRRIKMVHGVPGAESYTLDFSDESIGTQSLFYLSSFLYESFRNGSTLVIDEITCFHTALIQNLVRLFHDPEMNPNRAQLILITHDTNLLDLDLLRRDQVYFADRDDAGVSELYSLADFSARLGTNIEKSYLVGRYGAVPEIRGEVLK